jgi:hypothetical protein
MLIANDKFAMIKTFKVIEKEVKKAGLLEGVP